MAPAYSHDHSDARSFRRHGVAFFSDSLSSTSSLLRVTFSYGDVFRLRDFETVDPTIDDGANRWTATVVQSVRGKHLRPGWGLYFNESDISEIFDEASSAILFRNHPDA